MIANQVKFLGDMIRNQWKPFSELKKMQDRKLRDLVRHAYTQVPFYKDLLDSIPLKPEEIQKTEDLKKIPVTTKKQIQDSPLSRVISRNHLQSKCVEIKTSGSSGTPLRLFFERHDFSRLNMNWLRPLLAYGVRPWHRKMEITGPHNILPIKRWYNYLGFWRTRTVSVFKSPQEWLDLMNSYEPDILYGYSGSLKLLALHIQKNKMMHPDSRFIFGVSDLIDHECRELIYSTFKRKIIDLYGAAEAGCIAWECRSCEGYHINMDTVVVEFLSDQKTDSKEGQGRIVVTNLCSYAMPIIRYDLGDIGSASDKKTICGRELPLMRVIEGRDDAFIVLPSGERLSPMFFFGIMKPIKDIKQWRIYQDSDGRITVLLVPSPELSSITISALGQRIKANIRENIPLDIQIVDHIPMDPSGKVRAVVSKAKPS